MTSGTTAPTDKGGILAIHLGDNIGYCYDGKPSLWTLTQRYDHGYSGAALMNALADFMKLSHPAKIVVSLNLDEIESHDTASLLVKLHGCIQVLGRWRIIWVEHVQPSVVHQALFERSDMSKRALKSTLTGFAKRRGYANLDFDAAQALALWEYASRTDQESRVGEVKAA